MLAHEPLVGGQAPQPFDGGAARAGLLGDENIGPLADDRQVRIYQRNVALAEFRFHRAAGDVDPVGAAYGRERRRPRHIFDRVGIDDEFARAALGRGMHRKVDPAEQPRGAVRRRGDPGEALIESAMSSPSSAAMRGRNFECAVEPSSIFLTAGCEMPTCLPR